MASSDKLGVMYSALMLTGIFLAIIFTLLLNYSPLIFIILMLVYILGYSTFVFALMVNKRRELQDDERFRVARYISLFNILLMVAMIAFGAIMSQKIKRAVCY